MYKANKEQVNVFGLRTKFGGGKTTGFALIYDSPEALKKFEPHYRLIRVGVATKIEKPSRQQRTFLSASSQEWVSMREHITNEIHPNYRQATQEPPEDTPRYRQGQGCNEEEGEIDDSPIFNCVRGFGSVLYTCWFWETHCIGLHILWKGS